MTNEHLVTRREFTLEAALAMLAGVTITVTGCGGDSSNNSSGGGGTPTGPSGQDKTGEISLNHGHTATIQAAQLTAGNAISLNIQGQATHPHTVELSQSELSQISAGTRLAKASSTDNAHSHTVTFN